MKVLETRDGCWYGYRFQAARMEYDGWSASNWRASVEVPGCARPSVDVGRAWKEAVANAIRQPRGL